jgi:ubiquinone/menaquinone biosynthesis C-methylase UbiE
MLQRVLEPEVMDTDEEARDYDAMDHAAVNRVFVGDFLCFWDSSNPVLDVGTGTAQIPVELCRQSHLAEVVAIDLASSMLAVAQSNVQRAGLAGRIRLELVDAKALPFAASTFAALMSNSIIHHIPSPAEVLAEMARVVKPGGLIFVRDLLRPDSEVKLRELVNLYAADANFHQQKMFADSLHAALSLDEIRALVAGYGFDAADVQQSSDRHWTWCAMNRRV